MRESEPRTIKAAPNIGTVARSDQTRGPEGHLLPPEPHCQNVARIERKRDIPEDLLHVEFINIRWTAGRFLSCIEVVPELKVKADSLPNVQIQAQEHTVQKTIILMQTSDPEERLRVLGFVLES